MDRLPQVNSQPNVKQLCPLALQGGRSVSLPSVTPKLFLQGMHRSRMWRGQRGPSGTFLGCLVALSPTAFDQKPTEEGGFHLDYKGMLGVRECRLECFSELSPLLSVIPYFSRVKSWT